ncbi:hypothetical protein [Halorubrum cibi]|uniref:Conserved repeat domain-containing protein n=1 Tax=Halorubrum cibi TaxID=413815 RepID=A0A521BEG4_9EURY|nr:hypothetical protein [Halorubrum cibi]SMO45463.1 conserved repeat domain-containing protein [Halorubrum cibi]
MLLVLIGATALVTSTGAVVLDGPTDPLNDDVALQPGDNPYTFLDEDGELVVDVTEDNPRLDTGGVNVDAVSVEDDLFYVVYNGSEPAEVWIEHDSQAVTFVIEGQPAESDGEPALLTSEDEIVPVGVRIDTRVADLMPGDRVLDEVSVHARPAEPQAMTQEGGGSGGDGDDGDDDDASSDPTVFVDSPAPDAREVEVYSVAVGSETAVDLEGLEMGDPAVRLDRLSFVRNRPDDVEFSVEGSEGHPGSVAPVDRPGVDPLGYYAVSFAEPDQPIETATAEVIVDRDRLREDGVEPERLAAYHETDEGGDEGDDWELTATRVIAETDEAVRLAVESDGFSAFAIGARRPALEAVDATVSAETVAPGDAITLEVTLSNVGPVPASDEQVAVRAVDDDGTAVDALADGPLSVDVAPGGALTRNVTLRLDEPGAYDLVLDDDRLDTPATVASLAVRESEPNSEESSPGSTETASDGGTGPVDGADADSGTESGSDGTAPEPEPTRGTGSVGDESVSDGGGSADGTDPSVEPGRAERTEPAAFDPADFAGLAVLVAIVLATLFLVRRAPR